MLDTSRNTRVIINPLLAVSDGEADVSSLDTDAPDSSDNWLHWHNWNRFWFKIVFFRSCDVYRFRSEKFGFAKLL